MSRGTTICTTVKRLKAAQAQPALLVRVPVRASLWLLLAALLLTGASTAAAAELPDAVPTSGSVVAWGANASGAAEPPKGLADFTAVAAGKRHSVALREDGEPVAWGEAFYGGALPAGVSDVVAVAASDTHTLLLRSDGSVTGGGWSGYGALDPPAGLDGATAIAAGSSFSLALTPGGRVVGWGVDYWGQAAPPQLDDASAIAAGEAHGLALRGDGTVVGWGANHYGQAHPPADLDDVTAISAGAYHSLALRRDGTVVGWGSDSVGQASPPAGLSDVKAIAAGGFYSLALRRDGTVMAWGGDQYDWGEGGQPPTLHSPAAEPPAGLVGVIAIAAGRHHVLAVVGPPAYQVASLSEVVREIGLTDATTGRLESGLDRVDHAIALQRTREAARRLARWRDLVRELDDSGSLSEEHARALDAAAERVLAALGQPDPCPGSSRRRSEGSDRRAGAISDNGIVVGDRIRLTERRTRSFGVVVS